LSKILEWLALLLTLSMVCLFMSLLFIVNYRPLIDYTTFTICLQAR